jgi:hypothetical protein
MGGLLKSYFHPFWCYFIVFIRMIHDKSVDIHLLWFFTMPSLLGQVSCIEHQLDWVHIWCWSFGLFERLQIYKYGDYTSSIIIKNPFPSIFTSMNKWNIVAYKLYNLFKFSFASNSWFTWHCLLMNWRRKLQECFIVKDNVCKNSSLSNDIFTNPFDIMTIVLF